MAENTLKLTLPSSIATAQAAALLACKLHPGDVVMLNGAVGAGKTHFARSAIQSVLVQPEDVPSPTFTLVQTYQTQRGPLWHTDLYRISTADEIEELGLIDAFDAAICLVEWPDRLSSLTPNNALNISLEDGTDDEARVLIAKWRDPRWSQYLECWADL